MLTLKKMLLSPLSIVDFSRVIGRALGLVKESAPKFKVFATPLAMVNPKHANFRWDKDCHRITNFLDVDMKFWQYGP